MYLLEKHNQKREPWNKGKLMGQKLPLTLQEIWSIRMCLESEKRIRDMALFNLAIDTKLRACDLLKIRVSDVSSGGQSDLKLPREQGIRSRDGLKQRN